jgi:L-amino acid N-acyltransferase YncA
MNVIDFDPKIRLRNFKDEDLDIAQKWYSDPVVLRGVISPNQTVPLTSDVIRAMYKDLQSRGDLYIIDVLTNGAWLSIGDVTLAKYSMPIVIGDPVYRGRKIGKKVVEFLISKARTEGWEKISLKGIYKNNISSQSLFESCGFKKVGETSKCCIYECRLQ